MIHKFRGNEAAYLMGGLLAVPFGLIILLDGSAKYWWPFYSIWRPYSGMVTLVVALILFVLIYVYYQNYYGVLKTIFASSSPLVVVMVVVIFAAGVFATGMIEGLYRPLGISPLGVWIAMFLIFFGRHHIFHVMFGTVIALVSLLPLIIPLMDVASYVSGVFGAALILGGVYEHLLSVRSRD